MNRYAQVEVISPISWTDELRARRAGKAPLPAGRMHVFDGLTVYHPRYYFTPRIGRRLYGRFYEQSVSSLFYQEVKNFRPDIVFGSWAYPDGWAVGRLAQSVGLPAVVQVHGSDVKLLGEYPSKRRGTLDGLRRVDGIIAVSQDLADSLVRLGVDKKKVRVVYDGIDPSQFHPGDRDSARAALGLIHLTEPMLLFIGNLLPVKGLDILLPAIAKIVSEGTPVQMYLIGEGPLRSQLGQMAVNLGIADRVHFVGSIDHHLLPRWYHAANLFVLPSRSEGIPNVLLEAAGCGIRWVASNVGGIPEIVNRGRGLLIPPLQVDELADGIKRWLKRRPYYDPEDTAHEHPIQTWMIPAKTREQAVIEILEYLSQFVTNPNSKFHGAQLYDD